jgi:hypothetical protein
MDLGSFDPGSSFHPRKKARRAGGILGVATEFLGEQPFFVCGFGLEEGPKQSEQHEMQQTRRRDCHSTGADQQPAVNRMPDAPIQAAREQRRFCSR